MTDPRLYMANGQASDIYKCCIVIPYSNFGPGDTKEIRFVSELKPSDNRKQTGVLYKSVRPWCFYYDSEIPGTVIGLELDKSWIMYGTTKRIKKVSYLDRFEVVYTLEGDQNHIDAKCIPVWHLVKHKKEWLNKGLEKERQQRHTPSSYIKPLAETDESTKENESLTDHIQREVEARLKSIFLPHHSKRNDSSRTKEPSRNKPLQRKVPPTLNDLLIIDCTNVCSKHNQLKSPKILLVNDWYMPFLKKTRNREYVTHLDTEMSGVKENDFTIIQLNEHVNRIQDKGQFYEWWSQIIACDQARSFHKNVWSLYMMEFLDPSSKSYSTHSVEHIALYRASCPNYMGPAALAHMIRWRCTIGGGHPRCPVNRVYAETGTALMVERGFDILMSRSDNIGNDMLNVQYKNDIFIAIYFTGMTKDDVRPALRITSQEKCCQLGWEADFYLSLQSGDLLFFTQNQPVILPGNGWLDVKYRDVEFQRSLSLVMEMLGYNA